MINQVGHLAWFAHQTGREFFVDWSNSYYSNRADEIKFGIFFAQVILSVSVNKRC